MGIEDYKGVYVLVENVEWQACPFCDGAGSVEEPFWDALRDDIKYGWSPCLVCDGAGALPVNDWDD